MEVLMEQGLPLFDVASGKPIDVNQHHEGFLA